MPDVIVLCGGAGLRLRSVIGDVPKAMAAIGNRPFLELLLRQLRRFGFERVILAVGYGREVIHRHFGENAFGLHLAYSAESVPLGTGGALRNAVQLVESSDVLVTNGDSYTDFDLSGFVEDFQRSRADVSVLIVPAEDRGDFGTVLLNDAGKLVGFEEKPERSHAPYVNAGIYMMSRQILSEVTPGLEISLERELIPGWLRRGNDITGFVFRGKCIDIGTPQRYQSAQGFLATAELDLTALQHEG